MLPFPPAALQSAGHGLKRLASRRQILWLNFLLLSVIDGKLPWLIHPLLCSGSPQAARVFVVREPFPIFAGQVDFHLRINL